MPKYIISIFTLLVFSTPCLAQSSSPLTQVGFDEVIDVEEYESHQQGTVDPEALLRSGEIEAPAEKTRGSIKAPTSIDESKRS